MKTWIHVLLVAAVVCVTSCKTNEPAELRAFSEEVIRQIQAGDHQNLRSEQVEEIDFFAVSTEMKKAEWFQPFSERVGGYERLFMAKVKTKQGEVVKCFYSKEDGAYRRVGVYSDKGGNWKAVEKP